MPSLAQHLFARERDSADKVALRMGEASLTYGELAGKVRHAAGALAVRGIGVGTPVGLMTPTALDFVVVQQALFALGAIFTPLNALYRRHELAHAVDACGLEHLVVAPEFQELAPSTHAPEAVSLRRIHVLGDAPLRDDDPRAARLDFARGEPLRAPADLPETAVGMMLNTSATTGRAKAVMLTLANLRANYDRTPGWLGLDGDAITLCALPLYNTFGLNQGINATLATGGELVLMARFEAGACIAEIARRRCTFLPAVPTMLQKLLAHPDASRATLGSVTRIMTGGAPVPSALLARVRALMGPDTVVLTGYGLTEATALLTLEAVELDAEGEVARPKAVGRVLDTVELRIASTGDDADRVGEVQVRGPMVMAGYRGAPVETARAIDADGWLHTGDLGRLLDGHLYLVDRLKDVIIRGGQNIYPADICEALYRYPGVAEACVVGAPDEVLGETPVAFLAPAPGAALDPQAVVDHCRAELAKFNVPSAVHVLPELPKGPTGKLLARELRERLARGLGKPAEAITAPA